MSKGVAIVCVIMALTCVRCVDSPAFPSESLKRNVIVSSQDPETAMLFGLQIEHHEDESHFTVTRTTRSGAVSDVAVWTSPMPSIDNAVLSANEGLAAVCVVAGDGHEVACWHLEDRAQPRMVKVASGLVSSAVSLFPASAGAWSVWFQKQEAIHSAASNVVRVEIGDVERKTFSLTSYKRPDGITLCHPHSDFFVAATSNGEWLLSHELCVENVTYARGYEACLRYIAGGSEEVFRSCVATSPGPFTCSQLRIDGDQLVGTWLAGREEAKVVWERGDLDGLFDSGGFRVAESSRLLECARNQ